MVILQELLNKERVSIEEIGKILEERYSLYNQEESIENGVKHLAKEIFVSLSTAKEFLPIVERYEDDIVLSGDFKKVTRGNYTLKI